MQKARRTEEQIIGILQELEAGAKCADLCRKHGMSEGTFYAWKAKFSGMTVSEAKRLKALQDENARLKNLLAEQMLDMAAMREFLQKMVAPAVKREAVAHLKAHLRLPFGPCTDGPDQTPRQAGNNGTELTSNAILKGCAKHKVEWHSIAPGKSMQNRRRRARTGGDRLRHVESFNSRMRDEFLNETLFRNFGHARELIAAWVTDCNTERPHSALGYQTPAGFALHLTTAIARPAARDAGSARRAIAQPAPKGVNQQPTPVAAG